MCAGTYQRAVKKLDGRGQNFLVCLIRKYVIAVYVVTKKIMYGALRKHDCVSVPTYGLSRYTYYHMYVLGEFHCMQKKYSL